MNNKDLNRIKVVLVEHKRTNKWLAEQLGKDPATVSKWCTNSSQPSIDMFFRIAELLEVDYTDLIIKPKEQASSLGNSLVKSINLIHFVSSFVGTMVVPDYTKPKHKIYFG